MSEPVTVAVHLENMDVMREPVEQCARQSLGTEHRRPLVKRRVAGDDRRATFVTLAEGFEQQSDAQAKSLPDQRSICRVNRCDDDGPRN